jgi:hypothetical protein
MVRFLPQLAQQGQQLRKGRDSLLFRDILRLLKKIQNN